MLRWHRLTEGIRRIGRILLILLVRVLNVVFSVFLMFFYHCREENTSMCVCVGASVYVGKTAVPSLEFWIGKMW